MNEDPGFLYCWWSDDASQVWKAHSSSLQQTTPSPCETPRESPGNTVNTWNTTKPSLRGRSAKLMISLSKRLQQGFKADNHSLMWRYVSCSRFRVSGNICSHCGNECWIGLFCKCYPTSSWSLTCIRRPFNQDAVFLWSIKTLGEALNSPG